MQRDARGLQAFERLRPDIYCLGIGGHLDVVRGPPSPPYHKSVVILLQDFFHPGGVGSSKVPLALKFRALSSSFVLYSTQTKRDWFNGPLCCTCIVVQCSQL
jgi:hypothetical protein